MCVCVCVCVYIYIYTVLICFSCVRVFATLWTVSHLPSLSMGFSRQDYWRGLPYPPLGDLPIPNPEIKPTFLKSPLLESGFFTTSTTWETYTYIYNDLAVPLQDIYSKEKESLLSQRDSCTYEHLSHVHSTIIHSILTMERI